MNISFSPFNRTFFFLLLALLPVLASCSVLPGTLEVGMVPQEVQFTASLEIEDLKPVIEAILYGSITDRAELVSYTTTACTTADGLGGPPKCEPGEAEGTLVEVLPILAGEGTFSRPESVQSA
ncbi:MAG: hypothetical protein ACWGOY_15300, partial [Anaerolineales bacterium]